MKRRHNINTGQKMMKDIDVYGYKIYNSIKKQTRRRERLQEILQHMRFLNSKKVIIKTKANARYNAYIDRQIKKFRKLYNKIYTKCFSSSCIPFKSSDICDICLDDATNITLFHKYKTYGLSCDKHFLDVSLGFGEKK